MESKRRSSTPKSLPKQNSHSKSKQKKSASPALRDCKPKMILEPHQLAAPNKKKTEKQLVKKKI